MSTVSNAYLSLIHVHVCQTYSQPNVPNYEYSGGSHSGGRAHSQRSVATTARWYAVKRRRQRLRQCQVTVHTKAPSAATTAGHRWAFATYRKRLRWDLSPSLPSCCLALLWTTQTKHCQMISKPGSLILC